MIIEGAKYAPGERVRVGFDITGTVERVIFDRNGRGPIYLVEWWLDGDLRGREFLENDLLPLEGRP